MLSHNLPREALSPTTTPFCIGIILPLFGGAQRRRRGTQLGGHGPVCLPFHFAARRQGPSVHSGFVPRCSRARRVRRSLLLPHARSARAGCRRQRAAWRNRDLDRAVFTLLGGAGTL